MREKQVEFFGNRPQETALNGTDEPHETSSVQSTAWWWNGSASFNAATLVSSYDVRVEPHPEQEDLDRLKGLLQNCGRSHSYRKDIIRGALWNRAKDETGKNRFQLARRRSSWSLQGQVGV